MLCCVSSVSTEGVTGSPGNIICAHATHAAGLLLILLNSSVELNSVLLGLNHTGLETRWQPLVAREKSVFSDHLESDGKWPVFV